MLDSLVTSKLRVQILVRLFLNPACRVYLRELSRECGASPGHVRAELTQLSAAGLLRAERIGRQTFYRSAPDHPLYPDICSMVRKTLGVEELLHDIRPYLGSLDRVCLVGDSAIGRDSRTLEVLLIGAADGETLRRRLARAGRRLGRQVRVRLLARASAGRVVGNTADGRLLDLWCAEESVPAHRETAR